MGDQPYWVVEPPDYVSVLAITKGKDVLLVRQYRPAPELTMLELPSGYVEKGESPEQAARRELLEETGYQAEKFEPLGALVPDCGRIGNRLWPFIAFNATGPSPSWVAEAGVEVVIRPVRDLVSTTTSGEFCHALNLAVLFQAIVKYGPF